MHGCSLELGHTRCTKTDRFLTSKTPNDLSKPSGPDQPTIPVTSASFSKDEKLRLVAKCHVAGDFGWQRSCFACSVGQARFEFKKRSVQQVLFSTAGPSLSRLRCAPQKHTEAACPSAGPVG